MWLALAILPPSTPIDYLPALSLDPFVSFLMEPWMGKAMEEAAACTMRGAERVLTQPFLHCFSFYTFPPLTCRLHVSSSALPLWLIRGLLSHPQSVLTRNRNAETSITLHLSHQMFPADVGRPYSGSRLAIALQSTDAHSSLLLGVSCPRQ